MNSRDLPQVVVEIYEWAGFGGGIARAQRSSKGVGLRTFGLRFGHHVERPLQRLIDARLGQAQPAVDDDVLSRDEARCVRTEKVDNVCNLVNVTCALQGR